MEPLRCFIAIELPQELKRALKELQQRLQKGSPAPARWVDPNGIHLTLNFLGNVAADRIEAISGAMAEAARGIAPFQLGVGELGAFPNLKRVQIVWVGVGGEVEKLARLQQQLESALEKLGFPPEKRRFTPHLTLARLREQASPIEREKLGQLIAASEFDATPFPVEAVNLMRSQLTRQGAIYSRLSSVALK